MLEGYAGKLLILKRKHMQGEEIIRNGWKHS